MNKQDEVLNIGKLSTGWHSHANVLDAAKWLRDHSFGEFLDVVEKLLHEFSNCFEWLEDNESGEFCFQRRSDSDLIADVRLSSKVKLLHLAWDIARADPKAKMLNEFDGQLICSFSREIGFEATVPAFFRLSDELAIHRARISILEEKTARPKAKKAKSTSVSDETLKEADRIIDKHPGIKGNDFVGMLGIKRETALELWRKLTKKTKRRTTRESGSRMK